MHVGLAVPAGVTADGGAPTDAAACWIGAENCEGVVPAVEPVVPKGAALYAPTINRCTDATCGE